MTGVVGSRPRDHPPNRPGYAPVFRDIDLSFVLADSEYTDESAERYGDQDQESEGAYCDIDDHWYRWCLCGGWGG